MMKHYWWDWDVGPHHFPSSLCVDCCGKYISGVSHWAELLWLPRYICSHTEHLSHQHKTDFSEINWTTFHLKSIFRTVSCIPQLYILWIFFPASQAKEIFLTYPQRLPAQYMINYFCVCSGRLADHMLTCYTKHNSFSPPPGSKYSEAQLLMRMRNL